MITLCHQTFRDPDKESSSYLLAILLGCVSRFDASGDFRPRTPQPGRYLAVRHRTKLRRHRPKLQPLLLTRIRIWRESGSSIRNRATTPAKKCARRRVIKQKGGGGRWPDLGGRGMGRGRQRQGQGGDMMKEFSQLTITQTASMAKVTGESGRVLALYSKRRSIAKPVRSRRFEQVR